MLYLLTILFPLSIAGMCYVLRRQTTTVIAIAVVAMLSQVLLVAQIPLDTPVRLLGVTLDLNALTRLFLLVFLMVLALSFLASWHIPHGENFVPISLLILSLVATILLLQDPFIVSLLLLGSGLAAVLALVDLPTGAGRLVATRVIATALKYLTLMVLAGMLIYLGFVLIDIYRPGETPGRIPLARFILALLTTGFALRLALVPFHSWLPDLVEDAAPMVAVLVVGMLNTTSLLVLVLSFQRFPVLLVENPAGLVFLRVGAILTVVLAGLLALAQTDLRRTLAYLLIYGSGMVFYGLVSASTVGLTGAMFEAFNQTLAMLLIFVSVGLLERPDGRPPLHGGAVRRDLLQRWPIASLGLIGGGFALLGLPPFNGFASKLLLYEAAARQNWFELLLLLLATTLAGLALLRAIYDRLLGPGETTAELEPLLLGETEVDRPTTRRLQPEPRSTAALTLLLLVACLGIGLYPQPFLDIISDVIRGLTFVRVL